MQEAELREKIEKGSDILLNIRNKHFTIVTWTEEGIGIDEQSPYDGNMQFFETADDLLKKFLIDGECLGNLAEEVIITDYTGNRIE